MREHPAGTARELAESLKPGHLVGQMMMVGFPGTEVPGAFLERVASGEAGNVILFSRNVESPDQVRHLVRALQRVALANGLGLLVATDQEGGRVVRLKPPATWFPSAMALGATADDRLVERIARATAAQLRACGISMDLAPVLDIQNNPRNPVIGVRSFGATPELVASLGAAFIRGLHAEGVAATAKHFPGHGDTEVDSHLDLPVIPHPMERLDRVELVPFRAAMEEGVDAVMTAHVVFPAIEPDPRRPATHSAAVLQGLLRRTLGFAGVIVTDCLEMRAISERLGVGMDEAAVRAVEAGADLVLVSHTQELQQAAYDGLLRAVEDGRIPRERLVASVSRIVSLKERLGLVGRELDDVVPDVPFERAVDVKAANEAAWEAASRAVTVQAPGGGANWPGLVPLLRSGMEGVAVLELGEGAASMAEERGPSAARLSNALAQALASADLSRSVVEHRVPAGVAPGSPEAAPGERFLQQATQEHRVVVAVSRGAVGRPDQLAWLRLATSLPTQTIVVAMQSPLDATRLDPRPAVWMATYGDQPPHVQAAATVLAGLARAEGRCPVPAA